MESYIILNDDKQPAHQFKNGGKSWDEVKDFDNIAMIVPEPFVVLDFDTESDAKIMMRIVEARDIHCRVMKTDRGYHFWFRCLDQLKNFVKARLAVGIFCDRKVWGKNSYVVIKRRGQMREWIRNYDEQDVDFLPAWLLPVDAPSRFSFKGMKSGDGRNQELFNYIVYLQAKGFKRPDIQMTMDIINQFVFDQPLPKSEMISLMREEAFKSDAQLETEAEVKSAKKDDFKFHHEEFARELLSKFNVISINGNLFIYSDGYYQPNQNDIEMAMIMMYAGIRDNQRQEVLKYLRIIADKTKEYNDQLASPYIINVKNGRLNLLTGQLTKHSPIYFDFCRVPLNYDPEAQSDVLDEVLDNIFCHDEEVLKLVEEVVASCLVTEAGIYQKAFVFYGTGANGKSTFFYLLRKFLGEKNVSSIELDKLGLRFQTAELEYKLANIGDDLNYTSIRNNGTIKKLISGDAVQIERKNKTPYSFVSYATQVFATNDLPYTSDRSDGMMRRLCFIPCLAKFGTKGLKKNPLIKYKITEEQALSHLLNRAVNGLKRLQANGEYTTPRVVKEAKEAYMVDNSPVLQWVDEKCIDLKYITETSSTNVYLHFTEYCQHELMMREVMTRRAFNKELQKKFSLSPKTVQRSVEGKRERFYVVSIEE